MRRTPAPALLLGALLVVEFQLAAGGNPWGPPLSSRQPASHNHNTRVPRTRASYAIGGVSVTTVLAASRQPWGGSVDEWHTGGTEDGRERPCEAAALRRHQRVSRSDS